MDKYSHNSSVEGIEGKNTTTDTSSKSGKSEVVLRVLAFILTLLAAIVLGVNKQTTMVTIELLPTLPPVHLPATAKFQYLSAFVYHVVVNAIACTYAAVSLCLALTRIGRNKRVVLLKMIGDMMMVALLFSAIGASSAVGLIAYRGNSHVMWHKVCNNFGKFCHQAGASVALSLLGSIVFLLLLVYSAFRLQK